MSKAIEIKLRLNVDWSEIDNVRRAVALCVEAAFGSAELRDSLSMVSCELLENAVKYGKSGAPIGLVLEQLPDGLRVAVSNPIDDSSSHCDKLLERLAWLDEFDDVRHAYAAALQSAYLDACAGGLGLARIAHEGGCTLHCDTSARGVITVSARRARRPLGGHESEEAILD